jgi:CheY-like chemotaxis protein
VRNGLDDTQQPPKSRSVLLIDDNAIQAVTRQTILKRAGYHAIAALSARRALQQCRDDDFAAGICAVITDHIMPEMTGAEFVRELRRTRPELPVMVISGLEEAEAEYQGLHVRFLVKPLSPELLLANLRDVMGPIDVEGAA